MANDPLNQLVEEWKDCRNEIQSFNSHLLTLRIQGTTIFLAFIGAASVALQAKYGVAAIVLSITATFFISIIWGIDARLSRLMVAISQRAREIEKTPGIVLRVSESVHKTWCKLSWFHQRLDEFMYAFLGACGAVVSLTIVSNQFGLYMWTAWILVGVYLVGVIRRLILNERMYREEKK